MAPKTLFNAANLLGGLTLGAIAACLTGGVDAGLFTALGGLLGSLGGMSGNQSQGWLKEIADSLPPKASELFRNHHLRTLITRAAAAVVGRIIAKGEAPPTGTLRSAQQHIGAALDRALDGPQSPLADLHEWNLVDLLTGFAQRQGQVKVLTPEIWSAFLATLPAELWPTERRELAQALHEGFAEALWALVKHDAATDRQAFAAIEILYLSRILEATENPAPAPILAHLEQLIATLSAEQTELLRDLMGGQALIVEKLDAHHASLLGAIHEIRREVAGLAGKLDHAAPLQRYYQALREQFANYENLGLPVTERPDQKGEREGPIRIRDLFVPPHCADHHIKPAELDAAVAEGKSLGQPLLPLLQKPGQRIVLLADPGMGKSTVIQLLIATLADNEAPAGAPGLRGAIPFPFILRELVRLLPADIQRWNWKALLDAFRRWDPRGRGEAPLAAPLTHDGAVFHTFLHDERAFFLIDGLDEIGDPASRCAMRNAILEGFGAHREARWLITSRMVGYELAEIHVTEPERMPAPYTFAELHAEAEQRGALTSSVKNAVDGLRRTGGFNFLQWAFLFYLAPFDDGQQRAFAEHWYVPRMPAPKGEQRAAEFIAAVHQHPHTRVIGRIPNLLYLLALLYRHQAHLPNGRALVYEAISEAYLESIPLQRKLLGETAAFAQSFPEKEQLLAIVGLKMQQMRASRAEGEDGDILVSRPQLEEWLGSRFDSTPELHDFLDHVARHSGLLLPRGEGVYGFAHLSFQEYYAACQLKADFERILAAKAKPTGGFLRRAAPAAAANEERLFAEYAALPVWHEPLLFLVEKMRGSPDYTAQLVEWMFPQLQDDPAKGGEWMPFPAARLLATLSIDQEVALDPAQRAAIWQALWQADWAAWSGTWIIASSLVTAGNAFQAGVLQAAAALNPQRLDLGGCTALADLNLFAGLSALKTLYLSGCTALADLRPLAGLSALQELSLQDCTALGDLHPLAGLSALEHLDLSGCTALADLRPLAGLSALQSLYLVRCSALGEVEIAKLREALPKLNILEERRVG